MNIPGSTIYVVTTLELVQAIQKYSKSLAFPPIEAEFASKICGVSAEAHQILMKNVNGDHGDWGLSLESYAAMRSALLSSPELDKMNRIMVLNIAASLDNLQGSAERTKLSLAHWLRTHVTMATTNSIYGPLNPFKDEAVADGFWYVDKSLILFGVPAMLTVRLGSSKGIS